jgi:IPT/TIG domain
MARDCGCAILWTAQICRSSMARKSGFRGSIGSKRVDARLGVPMRVVVSSFTFLALLLSIGCGAAMVGNNNSGSTNGGGTPGSSGSLSVVISSISPSSVPAGSSDTTITIAGSNFGNFGHFVSSTAFWTTNGNLHDTGVWLQTTIVNSNQLTAVIPAGLLQNPISVHIVVMNGDVMGMSDGYFGYPRSNLVSFTVTP